jgi:hypothetical protein
MKDELLISRVKSHPMWEDWMINWVFVMDGHIHGYAPDNDCLFKSGDVDEFFRGFEIERIKWEEMY